MIYSIVVCGFDIDNDYHHDGDLIKAKSFKEAFEYAINYMGGPGGLLQK
jgi:anaerobic ribonucleoside-triphosphate reductase